MLPIESGLAVLVPAAELLVGPFRDKYDPSGAAGMPTHITLLYPFKSPVEIDQIVLDKLRECFSRFQPIAFSLSAIRRFHDGVLYLILEPMSHSAGLPWRSGIAIWKRRPMAQGIRATCLT